MGPSRAHGPSVEPAKANGLPEAHGLPKVMFSGIIVPPAPSLDGPAGVWEQSPHSPENGGSRGTPPALGNLSCFFLEKITEF